MTNYLKEAIGKWHLAIPFFLIFLVNIAITQENGFEYAGRLALFASLSAFLGIFFGLRWDSEVLVKDIGNLVTSVQTGLLSISLFFLSTILLTLVFSIENLMFFEVYVLILSATSVAIFELLINVELKLGSLKNYIFFRISQPMILYTLCIYENRESLSFLCSYLLPVTILLFLHWKTFSNLGFLQEKNFFIFKTLINKLAPTISALITNSVPLLLLILVSVEFGEDHAGIWINIYRIFNLPVAFIGAAFLPYLLSRIGDKDKDDEKLKIFLIFILFLFFISLFVILISFLVGGEIFIMLTAQEIMPNAVFIASLVAIGFMQYSLQYLKEIYQSINKVYIFLYLVIIELVLIFFVIFNYEYTSPEIFAYTIFFAVGAPFLLSMMISFRKMSYS